jgi:hypothetical protein
MLWTELAKLSNNPFKVDEPNAIIPAKSTGSFRIKFKPYEPNYYFFQILQCYCYLLNGNENKMRKIQDEGNPQTVRTLKLGSTRKSKFEESVNEEIDPPIWLNLRTVGHSFSPGSQPFLPMVKFTPVKGVKFPPCGPGESVYQTLKITNINDTPVFFKMMPDPAKVFRIYPLIGIIPGKSFGLVCFEFYPKSARLWSFTTQCVLNHIFTNVQNIHLSGRCFEPDVTLGNKGKLFFPPTYTGVSSNQKLCIKNNSRIPLEYECVVPKTYQEIVIFDPPKAILQANEERKVACTFTPLAKREYVLSIPLQITNIYDTTKELIGFYNPGSGAAIKASPKLDQTKYELKIVGAGNDGSLSIKPDLLNFSTVTVGFNKNLSLIVINKSKTNLYIDFDLQQTNTENMSEEEKVRIHQIVKNNFNFDFKEGIVPALSKRKVKINFKPSWRYDFDIKLLCNCREKPIDDLTKTITPNTFFSQKFNIHILAKGDYPLLRFADIRNDQLSVSTLWERFQLTMLNKELLTELTPAEVEYANSEKPDQKEDNQSKLRKFIWDFGKVPIKFSHKPRKITLTVK